MSSVTIMLSSFQSVPPPSVFRSAISDRSRSQRGVASSFLRSKILFPSLLLAWFGLSLMPLQAQEPAPSAPSGSAETATTPAAAPGEAPAENSPDIDLPVVEGQDILGLRIPHYNERGEMMMLVNAEVARRIDDDQIEMETMRIDFWNEERQQYGLTMPKSRYLIETRTLAGNDGALIQREDFRIEGQNLEFNLEKQIGVMLGEVTMTIQNVQTLSETE